MKTFCIFLLIGCLLAPQINFSQWEQTSGPSGTTVAHITTDGSNIYLTSYYDGIYMSGNSGLTWNKISSGLPAQLHSNHIAVSGGNIFAEENGNPGGIYFSSNSGLTWNLIFSASGIGSLIANGNTLYYGLGDFLYQTTNNGASWFSSNIHSVYGFVISLAVSGNTIFAGMNGVKMYRSTNGGANWSVLSLSQYDVSAILIKNNLIMAGTLNIDSIIYSSTDNGENWQPSFHGIPLDRRISSFNAIGNDIYTSTYVNNNSIGGIFKTTDNGNSWIQSGLTLLYVSDFGTLGNIIFAGTYKGVFKSTDAGSVWNNANTGLPNLLVNSMQSIGNKILVSAPTEGIIYSSNNGNNWIGIYQAVSTGLSVKSFGDRVTTGYYKSASYSTDAGENWNNLISLPAGSPRISAVGITDNTFLFFEYQNYNPNTGAVGVTTDYGVNWTYTNQSTSREFAFDGANTVYSATNTGVYRSTDRGFTWTNTSSGLSNADIISIAANNNFAVAGTNGAGPFLSTNSGINWAAINTGITNDSIKSIILKGDSIFLFSNTNPSQIYFSSNTGTVWISISGNLSGYSINAVSIDNNYLYASAMPEMGIQSPVWRRLLSNLTGIISPFSHIPEKYSLFQNYPNPFNPVTKIKYDLAAEGYVKIILYDETGKEIKTLVNEKQNAGSHFIEFDGTNLPSGIYFYRLITDSYTATRKLVLVK